MEGVERTNAVVVRESGQETGQNAGVPPRKNPFAMEVDQRRNCYTYRGFGHIAHYCRNRGRGRPMDGGRIEEILNFADNLKEGENLELLN